MNLPENIGRLTKIIEKGLGDPWRGAFLWVGAGLSIPAGYPSLGQLAERLREASLEPLDKKLSPLQTIDAFVKDNGTGYLLRSLADIFSQKQPLEYHKDLVRLPWKGIITTNYDELLEDALKRIDKHYLKVTLDRNLDLTARPEVPLFKVHGDIADFRTIVLDGKSYEKFNRRYPLLKADLESHLRKHSIVFFGCSMTDERLLGWLRRLGRGGRAALMPSCAVMTEDGWNKIPPGDRDLLEEGNIKPVLVKSYAEIPDLISHLVREILPEPYSGELRFSISFASERRDRWRIISTGGTERSVDVPWKTDSAFVHSLIEFAKMAEKAVASEKERAELNSHAVRLGEALGAALLTDEDKRKIKDATGQGGLPPLVTIESDDDLILSLPWELLRMDGGFAVRDGRIDLARSSPSISEHPVMLSPPDRYMRLVVNVSAPEGPSGGHLDYEAESYRIIRALHDHSEVVFTELGAADDMVDAIAKHEPTGVHFSGHGMPGALLFEDEEGMEDKVSIRDLLQKIRTRSPGRFPRFFYLASCHGNTPAKPGEGEAGSTISAAQLHREGVAQVVGYYGPIVDELSTMAEVAIYGEIANGRTTRHGVRQAREALSKGSGSLGKGMHRGEAAVEKVDMFPFAWAQLVFYHRGPDHPLSQKLPPKYIQDQEAKLQRSFDPSLGIDRRVLSTGFIGRKRELHGFRHACREGRRVFVFQGLGGLGKSTLAFKALPILAQGRPTLAIWCQEIEKAQDQAQELTNRISDFGQGLLKEQWIGVVQAVDRIPEATEPQRFGFFLRTILGSVNHIAIYLDNMESLLNGPDDEDPDAFGEWQSQEVEEIWKILKEMSGDKLSVVASCRYRNDAFNSDIIHVPEMADGAIFRMMGWFDGLRRLSSVSRTLLVGRLHGHPRAVEFLDGLIGDAIKERENRYGEWVTPTTEGDIKKEWENLIHPALPKVEGRLRQDLLLDAIWKRILDDRCRRMLFRMTLLRRPWDWSLMMELGEPGEGVAEAEKTADRLRKTSLLGQVEEKDIEGRRTLLFQIHPMTARFIAGQFNKEEAERLRLEAYRRVGTYLEELAKTSRDIRVDLDAGHYLFECGEFDRAYQLLGSASDTLRQWGSVRAGIVVLEPFEQTGVPNRLDPKLRGRLLGTLGLAYHRLGQVKKAIGYHEQALAIDREIGDRRGEGNALGSLGLAYAALGEVRKAIGYYEQRIAIAREIGDRRGEGTVLGNLGNAYAALGEVRKAIGYYEQALAIDREIGGRRGEGTVLGNLGLAYAALGETREVIGYYEQHLAIAREIGDRRGEGNALGNLGLAYAALGETRKAIGYYEQRIAIAREIGDRRGEGNALFNMGLALDKLGDRAQAVACAEAALKIFEQIEDPNAEKVREQLTEWHGSN